MAQERFNCSGVETVQGVPRLILFDDTRESERVSLTSSQVGQPTVVCRMYSAGFCRKGVELPPDVRRSPVLLPVFLMV